jgi:hypothetical protein
MFGLIALSPSRSSIIVIAPMGALLLFLRQQALHVNFFER